MAFSINLNTPRFTARLAVNDTISTQHMLAVLACKQGSGEFIDSCNGNIKAAFSMLIAEKLFTIQHVLGVKSAEQLAIRFNNLHPSLARIFTQGVNDWGIKVINLQPAIAFEFIPMEQSA